jgi:uncharacterized repeat protein (TIGR02543 family)
MKGKKIVSCLLAITMLFALFPATALADETNNTPTISWTMDDSTASEGYYKLVGHVNAPNGIKRLETWIAYDNELIVPWDSINEKALAEDVTTKDDDEIPYASYCGDAHLSLKKTPFSQIWGAIKSGTTTMWYCTQYLISGSLSTADQDYLEFYFTFKEGYSVDDLNAGSFSLYNSNGNSAVHLEDASGTIYKYFNGSNAASTLEFTQLTEQNVTLTYPNSTKTWGKAVVYVTNSGKEEKSYDTLTEACNYVDGTNSGSYTVKLTGDLKGNQTIAQTVSRTWLIDLQGKTIKGDVTVTSTTKAGNTITIYNGKIDGDLNIEGTASVQLQNITITGDVTNAGTLSTGVQYKTVVADDGFPEDVLIEGQSITIKGTLTSSGTLSVGSAYSASYSELINVGGVTITGGTVNIYANAMIASTGSAVLTVSEGANPTVTVKVGAQFKPSNLSAGAAGVVSGLTAEQIDKILDPDGSGVGVKASTTNPGWLIVATGVNQPKAKVASYNGTEYATLTTALAAASGTSKSVTLLTDVTEDINITISSDVKLDLAGYTLTGNINVSNSSTTLKNMYLVDTGATKGKLVGNITAGNYIKLYIGPSGSSDDGSGLVIEGDVTSNYNNAANATINIQWSTVTKKLSSAGALTIKGGTYTGGVVTGTIATIMGEAKISNDNGYAIEAGTYLKIREGCSVKGTTYNTHTTDYQSTGEPVSYNTLQFQDSNGSTKSSGYYLIPTGDDWYTAGLVVRAKFCNQDGTVIWSKYILNGTEVTFGGTTPTTPKNATSGVIYTFKGWSLTKGSSDLVTFPYTVSSTSTAFNFYVVFTETKIQTNGNDAEVPDTLPVKENEEITIDVTTDTSSDTEATTKTDASVTISSTTLNNMTENNTPSLTVKTDVADVTFDQDALSAIAGDDHAKANGVKLETKKTEKDQLSAAKQNAIQSENAVIIDLNLTDGQGNNVKFDGGSAEIKAPFTIPSNKTSDDFAVFYIDNNGQREKVSKYAFADGYVTFTAEHFSTYAVDEATGYTMAATVSGDTHFNVGDTVTVDIFASATEESKINSFQFTLDYNSDLLTLKEVTTALSGALVVESGTAAYNVNGSNQTISTTAVTIATATFTVNRGITSGAATIGLSGAEMTSSGYANAKTPAVNSTTVNLHNIKVTLKANSNSTINSGNSLTLYAKYDEAGLYSDQYTTTASVTPAASTGYRLADNNWTDGTNQVKDFAAIAALTFTDDATYTLQTVQQHKVSFATPTNGSLSSTADLTVDHGAKLPTLPTATADTGYSFDGWYVDGEKIDTATYTVTGDVTLTAKFTANTYEYATSLQNVTLSEVSGLTADNKATYGQEITFKATANSSYVLNTVSYQIGENASAEILQANDSGVYTIPGEKILGKVTILADTIQYHTITFAAGDGTTLAEGATTTAYVRNNGSTLYATTDSLKDNGDSDFTVPAVSAQENYRLANHSGESLWKDAAGTGYTATSVTTSLSAAADVTLTAQAIRTYTVTFTAGSNGALAEGEETSTTVDTGTAKSSVTMPSTKPDAGYVDDAWTWSADGDTITGNITATATFKDGSYNVTLPTVTDVTISAAGEGILDTDDGILATHGKDVTFTVTIGDGVKVTKVTYQIGSNTAVDALTDTTGNGIATNSTFEIAGANITDAISVTLTSNATYQITFAADDNGTVDGTSSIVKTFDEGYTIQEKDLPNLAGKTGYQFNEWNTNPVGQTVTAAATYTATFKKGTYTVTLPGGVEGIAATATYDSDLTFTPTATDKIITGVTAKIGDTPIAVTENNDGSYTIAGSLITGNIEIAVESVDGTLELISRTEYAALAQDTQVAILKTAKRTDNQKYTLSDVGDLYYSSKYQGYVTIVDATLTEAQLAAQLSTIEGAATDLSYGGDINSSGIVTASDSGVVNDILHGVELFYTPDTKMRLELDVNGDKKVSSEDIVWILETAVQKSHDSETDESDT